MNKEIIDVLKKADNIVLISHVGPDGDTLGSSAALREVLTAEGKRVDWYSDGCVPYNCRIIPGISALQQPGIPNQNWDVCVCVDISDTGRCGKAADILAHADKTINIDHHISNTEYAELNYVENVAATGEIIFKLIREMGAELTMTMAQALYIAISTDTGRFAYSNTTPETMRIVAELMETGIDVARINEKLYSERTKPKTMLIGRGIANLHTEGKIAYICLARHDFEAAGATDSDSEGVIDYARQIEGVEVAFLARETGNGDVKISLRSKETVDVCSVARRFSGGGHVRAAGCTLQGTLDEAVEKLLECIRGELA